MQAVLQNACCLSQEMLTYLREGDLARAHLPALQRRCRRRAFFAAATEALRGRLTWCPELWCDSIRIQWSRLRWRIHFGVNQVKSTVLPSAAAFWLPLCRC